jgi:hypothetical protein
LPRLEYRMLDEVNGYPVLYSYEDLDTGEIASRFACDKFIKDGIAYEKTSCAIEPMVYVIYVQEIGKDEGSEGDGNVSAVSRGVRLEVRQDGDSPSPGLMIQNLEFADSMDIILHLESDYLYWMGGEWLKTMTVLDEDRKVYVCYAKPGQ